MGNFSIVGRLAVTDALADYTLAGSWAFLAAVAVLAYLFTAVRAAVLGGNELAPWALRLLVIVAVLASYQSVFGAFMSASDDLTAHFADQAGWSKFSEHLAAQFQPLFEDDRVNAAAAAGDEARPPEPSIWDRVVGMMRGGILAGVTFVSYYLVFMVYDLIRDLAAVCAGLLRIAGPLLIAAGVFADGKTLRQWFSSLIQVALWPVLPPFMMMVIVGTSGLAAQTGNTAFILQQNVALVVLTLLTPLVVGLLMGRGGVSALGAVLTTMNVAMVTGATRLVAPSAQKAVDKRAKAAAKAKAAEARGKVGPRGGGRPQRRPGERPEGAGAAQGNAGSSHRGGAGRAGASRRPGDAAAAEAPRPGAAHGSHRGGRPADRQAAPAHHAGQAQARAARGQGAAVQDGQLQAPRGERRGSAVWAPNGGHGRKRSRIAVRRPGEGNAAQDPSGGSRRSARRPQPSARSGSDA